MMDYESQMDQTSVPPVRAESQGGERPGPAAETRGETREVSGVRDRSVVYSTYPPLQHQPRYSRNGVIEGVWKYFSQPPSGGSRLM